MERIVSEAENAVREGVVVVVRQADHYLMIRRAQNILAGGAWCFVGGGIEPGESQPDAVRREFTEEVGGTVTPLKKVWEWTPTRRPAPPALVGGRTHKRRSDRKPRRSCRNSMVHGNRNRTPGPRPREQQGLPAGLPGPASGLNDPANHELGRISLESCAETG